MSDVKSGFKTTEFWGSAGASIGLFLAKARP